MARVEEEAALIASGEAVPSLRVRIAGALRAELLNQTDRWRLWAPVAFGGGCGTYFVLKAEPVLWPMLLALASVIVLPPSESMCG